ncbi:MAG: hypothetical protein ACLP7Q_01695 [Isosphaeraceae bacterium]
MSQNVSLPARISPAQALAVAALASGSNITEAAEKAGVARKTVSRWVHGDPDFIAELQNTRAEIAAQLRCALETLGKRSIVVLREAVQNSFTPGTKLKAACAVLKLLGADRAETISPTTAEEVRLRLLEREDELRRRQCRLEANELVISRSIDVTHAAEVALAATGTDQGSPPATKRRQ